MRLLDTETRKLEFFPEKERPRYAILSHTWDNDEVLFLDIVSQNQEWTQKAGADKVLGSCQLARSQGYKYIWIDTCCIDKSSSAELSEAINSMFNWYMNAEVCYVYLTDVAEGGSIAECRWFTRGWTLQELIAPTSVTFYDMMWRFIDDKISMSSDLAKITGIDESLLRCGHNPHPPLLKHHHMKAASGKYSGECSCGRPSDTSRVSQLEDYCVAQKMSWASCRQTTRDEDKAYCLMGLFGVNFPLLYGEGGSRAFFRLQKEILGITHDQSILAIASYGVGQTEGALASGPDRFRHGVDIHLRPFATRVEKINTLHPMTTDLTKLGVEVELLVAPEILPTGVPEGSWLGILDFQMGSNPLARPAIPLRPVKEADNSVFCLRQEGLFSISPDHPQLAKHVAVRTKFPKYDGFLDRDIDIKALRRQRITIIQNFGAFNSRTRNESLPTPIRCISNSHGCRPYSVECENRGHAILQKPGYPRLLIETFKDESEYTCSVTGYTSLIWKLEDICLHIGSVPDETKHARQLMNELQVFQTDRLLDEIHRWGSIPPLTKSYEGSELLVVRGSPDLKVEVKVLSVGFLDWTTPEVTVTTTRLEKIVCKL